MKSTNALAKTALVVALFSALAAASGCNQAGAEKRLMSQSPKQARVLASVLTNTCTADHFAHFEKLNRAEPIEHLPEGLFLYSSADVNLESKSKPDTRLLARETPASTKINSQVLCVSRDSEPVDLDVSVKALTKIKIQNGQSAVTVRQFQAYINAKSHGMVALNPRLQAQPVHSLGEYIALNKARLFKLDDRTFAVLTERDQDDSRLQVLVTYELVQQN
jgi:hypothetical protein